jgi:hypothetical protein
MRKSLACVSILVLILYLTLPAAARDGDFGLGAILGEPTGPSFKVWTGASSAIDGAAAWSLDDRNSFHLHVDYLWHNFSVIKLTKGSMPLYFGLGGRIQFEEGDDDDLIGARIPVGLEYLPARTPLGIFMEIVPVLNLAPDTEFDMEGALGIRYYF